MINRRQFLIGAIAASLLAVVAGSEAAAEDAKQEFYELRIYRVKDAAKQQIVGQYLEKALVPALNRMGLDRIGVFTVMDDEDDLSYFVLVPYPTLEQFAQLNPQLAADEVYQKAAADYFAQPLKDPSFLRIENRLMKAFAGMPVIEMPAQTAQRKTRMFELRLYESHNEDAAKRKVDMFNNGEIQIMRDVEMAPVLYGETLVGSDVPNLIYMLSASDMEAHKAHWKAFIGHPEWDRMKKMEIYRGTVSKITKWFLVPTSYSQM